MLIVINYHYIRKEFNDPYPSVFGLTPDEFENQLDVLASEGDFIGARDLKLAIEGKKKLGERSWLITFDDGLREQYDLAWPILQKKGIPAIFFINTGSIESHKIAAVHKIHILRGRIAPDALNKLILSSLKRHGFNYRRIHPHEVKQQYPYDTQAAGTVKYLLNFALDACQSEQIVSHLFNEATDLSEEDMAASLYMDKSQIADLGKQGYIGSHSHFHNPIGLLNRMEAEDQIEISFRLLREWCQVHEIYAFSYPFGSRRACAPWLKNALEKAGCCLAFTMEQAGNENLENPFFLGRFSCSDMPGGNRPLFGIKGIHSAVRDACWHREETLINIDT